MNASEFHAWLATAAPGDRIEYFRGWLCKARVRKSDQPWEVERADGIGRLAAAAMTAGERGDVHLVQRRIEGGYAYLAEKRHPIAARASFIFHAARTGKSQAAIAEQVGLTKSRVWQILRGK